MILSVLLFLISFLLDGIIPNLFRGVIPFFMIASILVSISIIKDEKKVYLMIFIFGLLYDLTYFSGLIINCVIFLFLVFIAYKIINKSKNFFKMIFTFYLLCIIYAFINAIISLITGSFNIYLIGDKITNSILINSVYFIFIYVFFIGVKGLISNRKKKHSY